MSSGWLEEPGGVDYSLPPLKDWTFHIDGLAEKMLLGKEVQLPSLPTERTPDLCDSCLRLNFWSAGFSHTITVSDTRARSEFCKLCKMFSNAYDSSTSVKRGIIRFDRKDHVLVISDQKFPSFSIFRSPDLILPLDIPFGLPELPKSGSDTFFSIIKMWLKDCDDSHSGCKSSVERGIPTRLIEVGTMDRPLLRLVETREEKTAVNDYVALSHPWGDITKYNPFSTLPKDSQNGHGLEQFKVSIPFDELPATFKDAVICTRQIGVPYLWIDSICILQGPDGDFSVEAEKMGDVYNGAYCVIAASRAVDQRTGFLSSTRPQGEYVTFLDKDKPFYICKTIDNFNKDVIEGTLNKRGWVLQERALARRTIYFTETQTYFECGSGVRCETMTRMHNNMADFLGDPRFPDKAMRTPSRALKIKYFQDLFKRYTSLDLTHSSDRPFAISALEKRLQGAFRSRGTCGIFDDTNPENPGLFRRSLLWHRFTDDENEQFLRTIEFPANRNVHIPSWSWMAYEGRIAYFDPDFLESDWETKEIVSPWSEHTNTESAPQTPDIALTVTVRDFGLHEHDENEFKLVYDLGRTTASDGQRTQCVILARSKEGTSDREKWFYVLLVEATGGYTSSGDIIYKRVGAGYMLGKYIKLEVDGVIGKVF